MRKFNIGGYQYFVPSGAYLSKNKPGYLTGNKAEEIGQLWLVIPRNQDAYKGSLARGYDSTIAELLD